MVTIPHDQQGPPMSLSPDIARPVAIRPLQRLGLFIAGLNLRTGFLRFAALSNGLILLSLIWMLLVPDSSLGVLRYLQEDTGISREILVGLIASIFFMDISQSLRGIAQSYAALFAISGQGVLAIITLVYTLTGKLSLIALFGHGGLFALNVIGIVVVVQSYAPTETRYSFKRLMFPAISVLMAILAWGLVTRPDTAITQFIQGRYGALLYILIVSLLAWGSGQLRQNHLTPDRMIRRLMGIYFFVFMNMALFVSDDSVSLLGVTMNALVACVTVFYAMIQAQEYPG